MTIEVGSTVKGTVLKVADYGAIVRLAGGETGLIHISEIADTYVRDVREYVKEEDEVTVKVLRLSAKGRYELSLKQCDAATLSVSRKPEVVGVGGARHLPSRPSRYEEDPSSPRLPVNFEDRLSRFLKDSEERQHDLKRHIESKRGKR
ncbi:MAG: S1 RNA-binding domain-containing protein [Armatimonadetes bacterium]|nr:S1 RNA-binding domain-containing protein [Armatimonadota bacterium]